MWFVVYVTYHDVIAHQEEIRYTSGIDHKPDRCKQNSGLAINTASRVLQHCYRNILYGDSRMRSNKGASKIAICKASMCCTKCTKYEIFFTNTHLHLNGTLVLKKASKMWVKKRSKGTTLIKAAVVCKPSQIGFTPDSFNYRFPQQRSRHGATQSGSGTMSSVIIIRTF